MLFIITDQNGHSVVKRNWHDVVLEVRRIGEADVFDTFGWIDHMTAETIKG